MKPELTRSVAGKRDYDRNRIVVRDRFLDEADHVVVVDGGKAQIAGLLQGVIALTQSVERRDVIADVPGLVPVAVLELVFFRVEIFLAAEERFVLEQLEAAVDTVI